MIPLSSNLDGRSFDGVDIIKRQFSKMVSIEAYLSTRGELQNTASA